MVLGWSSGGRLVRAWRKANARARGLNWAILVICNTYYMIAYAVSRDRPNGLVKIAALNG